MIDIDYFILFYYLLSLYINIFYVPSDKENKKKRKQKKNISNSIDVLVQR